MDLLINKPKSLLIKNIEGENSSTELIIELKKSSMHSFALLPLIHNRKLTGALELYADSETMIDEKVISCFDCILPVLGQYMKNIIDDFKNFDK